MLAKGSISRNYFKRGDLMLGVKFKTVKSPLCQLALQHCSRSHIFSSGRPRFTICVHFVGVVFQFRDLANYLSRSRYRNWL